MTRVIRTPDTPPLASTILADEEKPSDAILRVAKQAGVVTDSTRPRLYDLLESDSLDRLLTQNDSRSADGECTVVAHLWGRTFVIRESEVILYP